jgi:hypothetical protein
MKERQAPAYLETNVTPQSDEPPLYARVMGIVVGVGVLLLILGGILVTWGPLSIARIVSLAGLLMFCLSLLAWAGFNSANERVPSWSLRNPYEEILTGHVSTPWFIHVLYATVALSILLALVGLVAWQSGALGYEVFVAGLALYAFSFVLFGYFAKAIYDLVHEPGFRISAALSYHYPLFWFILVLAVIILFSFLS